MSEQVELLASHIPAVAVLRPDQHGTDAIIARICDMDWEAIDAEELTNIAWVYYFFSIQFCENVGIARRLYPDDARLAELDAGERNTDNLSPYPGVVTVGERVDHDEFMRRALQLTQIADARRSWLRGLGEAYLTKVRAMDDHSRALSLASYEDGGLEAVFRAIRRAQIWDSRLLQAFRHFLDGHIMLDSDAEHGHGSLCRHLTPQEETVVLWQAFHDMIVAAAPSISR